VLAAAGATSTLAHRVRVRLGLGLVLGLWTLYGHYVDIVDMLPAAYCGRLRLQPTVTPWFSVLVWQVSGLYIEYNAGCRRLFFRSRRFSSRAV